jgi:hypothetical protein
MRSHFPDALADYIRRRSPLVFCRGCIVLTFVTEQTTLREAVTIHNAVEEVVKRPGFANRQGVCCGCVRSDDVIEWTPE